MGGYICRRTKLCMRMRQNEVHVHAHTFTHTVVMHPLDETLDQVTEIHYLLPASLRPFSFVSVHFIISASPVPLTWFFLSILSSSYLSSFPPSESSLTKLVTVHTNRAAAIQKDHKLVGAQIHVHGCVCACVRDQVI